ncbi:M28 family metallopeptidase [Pontibacter silvestris]|uniref:M28 family metallopeptidase n=1 Tax=Pontibacter silvestris TaxID=2305183 RepID=A0ABW4WUF3_9BACT|nr:M28 family peptidase [Pontibacter silvestris]MCC9136334.1 M28 family peptidase [Pontibacter silvestris]
MKQLILSFLFSIILPGLSLPVAHAQDMQRVRQVIDTLTSSYMHGRGYIFEGDTKATDYIQSTFHTTGLKPVNNSNSYHQNFALPVNRVVSTPYLKVDGTKLAPGLNFVAQAGSPSAQGTAKVLQLDTLIFSDNIAASKFFSQDFSRKALVYRQQDVERLSQLPEPYQLLLQKAKVQVMLQQGLLTTVARQQNDVPVLEVLEDVWPSKAKKITYNIQADFAPAYKTQNIIAVAKGNVVPDSFIVFSAHYDHLGGQGKGVYFPGANDNASGTAMLLELAEYYSQPEHQPKYSIVFMAFAAEEAGLVGSSYYVQHPLFPLSQIKFLINLDLLGTGDKGMMVVNGTVYPEQFNLLRQLNEKHQYLPQIRSRGKAANSDHYPFSERGVPAFFFYTLGGTAAYHNILDRPEQLPLTKFPEVFKLIIDFADELQ